LVFLKAPGVIYIYIFSNLMTTPPVPAPNSPYQAGLPVGDFVLTAWLGSGGAGEVWRAENLFTHHEAAIKFCHDEALRATLLTEAETLGQLQKVAMAKDFPEGVVKLLATQLTHDPPHLIMEYCPGGDLRGVLQRFGPLPPRLVATWTIQVANALTWAHGRNILHRDIKPENLLLADVMTDPQQEATPLLKVGDFGLGRAAATRTLSLHRSDFSRGPAHGPGALGIGKGGVLEGTSSGTLDYMAPEQVDGKSLSAATDLYSLGIVVFEMLTGRRPRGVVLPSRLRPGLHPAWDRVFERLYQYEPERRYASAAELVRAIETDLVDAPRRASSSDAATPFGSRVGQSVTFDASPSSPATPAPVFKNDPNSPLPAGTHVPNLQMLPDTPMTFVKSILGAKFEVKYGVGEGRAPFYTRVMNEGAPATITNDGLSTELGVEGLANDAAMSPAMLDALAERFDRVNDLRLSVLDAKGSKQQFLVMSPNHDHLGVWSHAVGYGWPSGETPAGIRRAQTAIQAVWWTLSMLIAASFVPWTAKYVGYLKLNIIHMGIALGVLAACEGWLVSIITGARARKGSRMTLTPKGASGDVVLARAAAATDNPKYVEVRDRRDRAIGYLSRTGKRSLALHDPHGTKVGDGASVFRKGMLEGQEFDVRAEVTLRGSTEPALRVGHLGNQIACVFDPRAPWTPETRMLALHAGMAWRLRKHVDWFE